jgi:hypothetical protein
MVVKLLYERNIGAQAKPTKKQLDIFRKLHEASKGHKMGTEDQTKQLERASHAADKGWLCVER